MAESYVEYPYEVTIDATCDESGSAAIKLVIVVLKLASSPSAAASSLSVLRAPGAASMRALICDIT